MALHTEIIKYAAGDTALEGYLAYDAEAAGPRPGPVSPRPVHVLAAHLPAPEPFGI